MTTVNHDGITYEVNVETCNTDSNEARSWAEIEYAVESIKPQEGFGYFDLGEVVRASVLNDLVIEAYIKENEG